MQQSQKVRNPLLQARMPFFDVVVGQIWANDYPRGRPNKGPFSLFPGLTADASWRDMLPFQPAQTQLLLHIVGPEGGEFRWLDFDAEASQSSSTVGHLAHPRMLTFGLVYDILENAWFHSPLHLEYFRIWFSIPEDDRSNLYIREEAMISDDVKERLQPHPGRIILELTRSDKSREELDRERRKYLRPPHGTYKEPRFGWCGTRHGTDLTVYKDEFHIAGGLSMDDISWNQRYIYCCTPEQPPPPSDSGRALMCCGIKWRRRKE